MPITPGRAWSRFGWTPLGRLPQTLLPHLHTHTFPTTFPLPPLLPAVQAPRLAAAHTPLHTRLQYRRDYTGTRTHHPTQLHYHIPFFGYSGPIQPPGRYYLDIPGTYGVSRTPLATHTARPRALPGVCVRADTGLPVWTHHRGCGHALRHLRAVFLPFVPLRTRLDGTALVYYLRRTHGTDCTLWTHGALTAATTFTDSRTLRPTDAHTFSLPAVPPALLPCIASHCSPHDSLRLASCLLELLNSLFPGEPAQHRGALSPFSLTLAPHKCLQRV